MNPLAHLLPALLTALTGLVDAAGNPVPVYEHLPGNNAGHYVLLEQPSDADGPSAAGCEQFSCTVLVNVVTQFAGRVTSSVAEGLVSQINARLRRQSLPLPAGWTCGPGSLTPGLEVRELTGELQTVRRLLRYRWTIYYTPSNI